MKRNILTLIAFILCLTGFSQKNFEGTVSYDITYQIYHTGINEALLKEIFGTKLKFYIKDGSYSREYFDESGKTLRKYMYVAENNRLYITTPQVPDTAFYSNASEKLFDAYQIENGPTDTILNFACPSKVIMYRYYEKMFEDTLDMKLEYFFCTQLAIDPNYYKNYYIWYDVIKEHKSVAIKFTEDTRKYFKIIYTATKIEPQKLSKNIFEFDKRVVLIYQSMRG